MTASLRLPAQAREVILSAASASPRHEICGLLVEMADGLEARLAPNVHPDPERGFAICDAFHARLQREVRERGGRIVGCFHSHPSGDTAPSDTDLLAANEHGFVWLICAPDGKMRAWRARVAAKSKSFEPMLIE